MGLPDIIIEFSKKAVTAIQNGSIGIVGIMLKDAKNKGAMVLRSVDEIPTGDSAFSAENTAYIERAFIGSPSKVIIYTMDTTAESYDEATKYFATQKVNYIVGAPDLTTEEATKLATWVKGIRKNSVRRPVAVLPKTAGDSRGVINFEVVNSSATNKIEVGEKGYLRGLEATEGGKGWLKADSSTMEINVAKQKQYLESIGVDTSEMDEQAIKEANTGSHVFLKGTISILDAIEDVDIFINKD